MNVISVEPVAAAVIIPLFTLATVVFELVTFMSDKLIGPVELSSKIPSADMSMILSM